MKAVKAVFSPVLSVLGLLPKTPKLPAPQKTPTRDEARDAIAAEDALRRRRGGAADIMTGSGGAEAGPAAGGKDTLGS